MQSKTGRLRKILWNLGPGVITGAADDDPAGIATYSIAGASQGLGLLYTSVFTWPLMGAVQMMCARIGLVTGQGLIGSLRQKLPRPIILLIAISLFAANVLNIGADLAGMADAAQMLTKIDSKVCVILFGAAITVATVKFSYRKIANWLRWLALALFAYIVCAFLVVDDWPKVAAATFIPHWPKNNEAWQTFVAILGTTISPYLFFWQTSLEVEESKSKGQLTEAQRKGATKEEILMRKWDVDIGRLFSNLVMYFIILTTALTLHSHGITKIETSRQAAEALKPLAGNFATLLYTLGIVAVGLLAIPTLAGSAAYAFADTFKWRQGLAETPLRAKAFYFVIIISGVLGICFNFIGFNPVKALFWSAVVNGILAPFLLVGIMLVACDKRIMNSQPSHRLNRCLVGITTVIMFAAAAALFIF
jgi:NRAMP (natural resistance-associated macrophage protein)-like metal ion transporter